MKTSSAKAKGRRAAQEVKELLLKLASHHLQEGDIIVTSSGECGEDLKLSPRAREVYPLSFECKNVEKLNVWEAIKQAEAHAAETNHHPVVAFKRNHTKLRCIVDLELFLSLVHLAKCTETSLT